MRPDTTTRRPATLRMLRLLALRGALAWSLLAPLGCDRITMVWHANPAPPAAWYPLDPGHRWRYRVAVEKDGQASRTQLMIRNLPGRTREGTTVTPQQVIFGPHGSVLFVRASADGVAQIGEGSAGSRPRLYPLPVYLLKPPLEEGRSWRAVYRPVFFGGQPGIPLDVPIDVEVAAEGETVQVPAGRFEGCLKVVARGVTQGEPGSSGLDFERTAWYAKDVGMVKSVSSERVRETGARGSITLELELQAPGAPAAAPG